MLVDFNWRYCNERRQQYIMKLERCPLCGSNDYQKIYHGIRKYSRIRIDVKNEVDTSIGVLKCRQCGLVRLSNTPDNVDEFFRRSGMRDSKPTDAEESRRANDDQSRRYFLQTEEWISGREVVDFGCGCGGYLCYAREKAKRAVGVEIEDAMRSQLIESGFECVSSIDSIGKVDVITLFHVLSHFEDPLQKIASLKQHLKPGGILYIETPNIDDALLSLYHSKAFEVHAFHRDMLLYWSKPTLELLAEKSGLSVDSIRFIQRYPLANHLYWLSNEKPGGHVKWDYLGSEELNREYGKVLADLGKTDTIICILRN